MRTREPFEPEEQQVDTDRMADFLEHRREKQANARRQRIQLVVIAVLGLLAIVLTVSNAVLVSRLLARPVASPSAGPPPVRSVAPSTRAPAERVAPPAAETESAQPAAAPRLADRTVPTPPPPRAERADVPSRVAAPPRPQAVADASTGETDPARRTARWLVQTYGPLEAENRAHVVTQFYTDERERAFWRRVLAHVRAAR